MMEVSTSPRVRGVGVRITAAAVLLANGQIALGAENVKGPCVLYVATNGSDHWSGRAPAPSPDGTDGPLASIECARDEIRRMRLTGPLPDGGATVCVRGGVYELSDTLRLTADDGGTAKTPIVYRAYKDEPVRLIGGKGVTGFKPVTDRAVLDRLDKAARGKVLQADLKALGITDYGKLMRRGFVCAGHPAALELFFQDRPMTLARYPNEGWLKIKAAPAGQKGGKFTYEGDRPKRWSKADDIWVHGYWTRDWADTYEKVASIDTKTRTLTTVPPHGAYGYKPGQRFYVHNLLEELDAPGEWYVDRKTGILYFWPPAPIEKHKAYVSILHTLVSMENTAHVTLRGFAFECCRGTGVLIRGGSHNRIAGCTLRNIGGYGASIRGGTENGAVGCDVYHTGDGGIGLSGGDRRTLKPGKNYAENNHIHHFARWSRTYRPAVSMGGVGNRIRHNLIHDGPHAGIQGGGNDHLVEFNEIHSICQETGDVGAFYIGRDWTQRGNVIRHNFFHHIRGPYTHGAMAVYLDDAASGATIFGNVFYRASRAAFIGGGRDNVVENNIFVDCKPSVHIDTRCIGWAKKYAVEGGGWKMRPKLHAVNYKNPPYSTRYPRLPKILEDDPLLPKGNVIVRNVSYGGRWMDAPEIARKLATIKDNLIADPQKLAATDPRFVDPGRMNFQLADDSPAYKLGFKKIPIEKIGLYTDAFRRSLPAPKRDWNDFVPLSKRPKPKPKSK